MSDHPLVDSEPTVILVTVEESDDYPESLVFITDDGPQRLFAAPTMNQTPAQSQRILKMRAQFGERIALADATGHVHATIAYSSNGDATMTYFDPGGSEVWTAPIGAEHSVPDTPAAVPRLRRMYRWLAVAFGLFLFVTIPFLLVLPVAGATFVVRAGIGFVLAVAGGIAILQAVRSKMGL